MMRWQRLILCLSGICGCTGVVLAALSAHLPESAFIPNGRGMLSRGVEMLMWHGLALMGLALSGQAVLRWVAFPMAAGTLLFVIPVAMLALHGPSLAFLAPWGGTLTILSWLLLAVLAFFVQRPDREDRRKRETT